MSGPLRLSIDAGIATLTLDRPACRNALSRELLAALRAGIGQAVAEATRAIIVTGAGGCFSAGADFSELTGSTADAGFDDALADIVTAIRTAPATVIAAIDGPCMGAALDLALACDLRVASAQAAFELPALRLGLLYNPAAIARLQRSLPANTVARLLLLGERITGPEAAAAGLATHVAAGSSSLASALEMARKLLAFPPRAATETKRLLVALAEGASDVTPWQAIRMDILGSPERRVALAWAKAKKQESRE
jgi:enoyl-CoA hydratase/carnithine racemase